MIPKTLLILPIAVSLLSVPLLAGADDALPAASVARSDGHISWHEFLHELGSYPQARSTMSEDGVVSIYGHVDGGIERTRIEKLARKIRGATDVRSQLDSD